jgi:hypothetical protein
MEAIQKENDQCHRVKNKRVDIVYTFYLFKKNVTQKRFHLIYRNVFDVMDILLGYYGERSAILPCFDAKELV